MEFKHLLPFLVVVITLLTIHHLMLPSITPFAEIIPDPVTQFQREVLTTLASCEVICSTGIPLKCSLPTTSARRKPVPTVPPVEDEASGDYEDLSSPHYNEDDDEGSGLDEDEGSTGVDKPVPPFTRAPDFGFGDNPARTSTSIYTELEYETDKEDNVKVEALKNLITHPAVLAAIIIGGVLTLLFIILLIMFIIYRMRKKDEGSYILDDPKAAMIDHQQQPQPTSTLIYTKGPSNDQEFYA